MPKININGKIISLSNKDFLAQGGEGSVYIKNKIAYKVYNDPKKMISTDKIRELSCLKNDNIIKPEEVFYINNNVSGYTMKYISDSVSLCRIFTKSFKDKNNITSEISFKLIKNMQDTVSYIHKNGVLIVDLNEMNFLVDSFFNNVYFIDVDSYQTKSYPATALMESVRDRHSKNGVFSKDTDWFSFAIVSFQLFVGIHPYKGKHPTFHGFEERMVNNISVFNKDVKIPKCCCSFDIIPSVWKDWYKAVFENGLRCSPPKDGIIQNIGATIISTISGSDNFIVSEWFECKWDIINCELNNGKIYNVCTNGININGKLNLEYSSDLPFCKSNICFYKSFSYSAYIKDGLLNLYCLTLYKNINISDINVSELMTYNGRLYAKQVDKLLEIEFFGSERNPIVTVKIVSNIMENSTQIFSGVAIQSVLGSYYVSVFPESSMCYQYHLVDLDGYKIVNAKYENGILIVIGFNNGVYDRFVYSIYKNNLVLRIVRDLQSSGINFTVLDNGICILINDLDDVEIFSVKNINKVKCIQDNIIHSGMKLFHDGNSVLFTNNKKLFNLKMK